MRTGFAALVVGCVTLLSAGCNVMATPQNPEPNVLADGKLDGVVIPIVDGVQDEWTCKKTAGLRNFCHEQTRAALTQAFSKTIEKFFTGTGAAHTATLRVLDISLQPDDPGGSAVLTMKWQFVINGPSGDVVFQTTGRTNGPNPMISSFEADRAMTALLEAAVEAIAADLNATFES